MAVLVVVTRDQSHRQPDPAEMEALVGASLTEPTYQSSSLLARWREQARVWWIYLALPIPNQMSMRLEGDVWTYTFAADSSYQPPPESPLAPAGPADARWEAESADGWRYTVWVNPGGGGTLVAQLLP
ncbi:MAG: hypothetical protein AAGK21_05965 [Bacteroidota bacterium]